MTRIVAVVMSALLVVGCGMLPHGRLGPPPPAQTGSERGGSLAAQRVEAHR